MTKVTALEVAQVAGVSQSAVSRAYTPGASVSRTTADKVFEAARQLGYRPNVIARSLITGKSRIVALVVAYLENQFYPEALEKLSHAFRKKGYHILVFMASNDKEETERVVEDLLDYQVDGLVAASVAMTQTLAQRCRSEGIPVMLFNRHQGIDGPSSVTSDNFDGARKIARFLASGGHERIAHVSGWLGSSTGRERADGFEAGLAERGMQPHSLEDGMYSREVAAEATLRMFAPGKVRPDAIFVGNDHMAFAVVDALRHDLGLRVPGDVSVVGYDDVPQARWASYDLTTMRQPLNRLVEETVESLLARIADPNAEPVQLRIPCELKVRASARVPEGWK